MAEVGFFGRLKAGLSRSTQKLGGSLALALGSGRLDDAALEAMEEALIGADLGPGVAAELAAELRRTRFGKDVSETEIREVLARNIAAILAPVARPLVVAAEHKPFVILMTGVNGAGKTTTIGKLAAMYAGQGKKVMLAAGDTFRAAAVEQLQIWGSRAGAEVVAGPAEGDAAALAHNALARAREAGADILLIDTAGRLHNKTALMEELRKIIRVIRKLDPTAPHAVLLTLDATTGQNALAQVRVFAEMVALTGLIVTKLDGSARGGIVVALAASAGLAVHAVGVGEQMEDLRPFEAKAFADALVGL